MLKRFRERLKVRQEAKKRLIIWKRIRREKEQKAYNDKDERGK